MSINRFTARSVQQLAPGTTLNFKLLGTPNATANFSIEGVAYNIPMREESNGVYTGEYTIRSQDYFPLRVRRLLLVCSREIKLFVPV